MLLTDSVVLVLGVTLVIVCSIGVDSMAFGDEQATKMQPMPATTKADGI